jgi:hypothetical protein
MNSPTPNRSRPFLSAMAGTILISLGSVWLATLVAPVTVTPHGDQPPSSRNFQISPIPPGADWTS